MRIITLLAGAAVGYVLGARAGRESYDRLVSDAQKLWKNPRTQRTINDIGETVKEKAPEVGHKVSSAASSVVDKARGKEHGKDTEVSGDHVSDPALSTSTGNDWSDEGGATPSGPAVPSSQNGSARTGL